MDSMSKLFRLKVDKTSMLKQLETRARLLDRHLAEYVSLLPSILRVHNYVLTYLLKKVATDHLPTKIIMRTKQVFGVPIKRWFCKDFTSYADDLLYSARTRRWRIFDLHFIRILLKIYASTKRVSLSEAIWSLLYLEIWFHESAISSHRATYLNRNGERHFVIS